MREVVDGDAGMDTLSTDASRLLTLEMFEYVLCRNDGGTRCDEGWEGWEGWVLLK